MRTNGGGTLDTIQLAALTWYKGAALALLGAFMYAGVSAMVMAGISTTGVLVGASAATIAAVTAVSGCIGGAASIAVTLYAAGFAGGWKQNLSDALTGCMTGAIIALMPVVKLGRLAGNAIRGGLGISAVATIGAGGAQAARGAGLELSRITTVTSAAADSLVAAR
ncbi:MAG TPA: hypothetical protein VI248_04860 [Kineosporiaceae bacterium]